ncbi:Predicted transcriptional regulator [uncultured Alphaproteobacteria bacterium]|uniref:Predicted transcriptional regulator n=1 Tax=uncultured Alphaproteobacteria bacterium TaxID=91750 RepID=A0A212K9G8_9PROT|nr:Predicted transcriptional regulator [uncultured Alphaproteobacteria bacterium]
MLSPSKKTLFAIEAVLDIAYNAGGEPVQSSEITARQGIPRRYLEQTLQALVRANVLIGVRGPKGGYRLARERRRISVGDIVRVVQAAEGPPPEDNLPHSDIGVRVIQPMWEDLQGSLMAELDALSIDTLCQRASETGVPCQARDRLSYDI